eukprot:gene17494-31046_t
MAGTSHTPVLMQRLQKATRERAALAAAAKQLSQRLGAAEARLKNLCYGGPAVIPPTNPSASASSAASAGLTASPPLRSASSSAMPPHKNRVHVADVRQSEGDTNKTTKSSSKKTKEEAVNENENENVNVAKGTKDLPDLSAESISKYSGLYNKFAGKNATMPLTTLHAILSHSGISPDSLLTIW